MGQAEGSRESNIFLCLLFAEISLQLIYKNEEIKWMGEGEDFWNQALRKLIFDFITNGIPHGLGQVNSQHGYQDT